MSLIKQILFCLCALTATALGGELDGICRLSATDMSVQWSGIAISEHRILTVAHHDLAVGRTVRAEFGVGQHGAFERVGVKARILKNDKAADLSLLSYEWPTAMTVRYYPVGGAGDISVPYTIAGYVLDDPMQVKCYKTESVDLMLDGTGSAKFSCRGLSGMSGSGAVQKGRTTAIQRGCDYPRSIVEAAPSEVLLKFIVE